MKHCLILGSTLLFTACAIIKPNNSTKPESVAVHPESLPADSTHGLAAWPATNPELSPFKAAPKKLTVPVSAPPSPSPPASVAVSSAASKAEEKAILKQVDSLVTNLQHEVHKDSAKLVRKLPLVGVQVTHLSRGQQQASTTAVKPNLTATLAASIQSSNEKTKAVASLAAAAAVIKKQKPTAPLRPTPCRWELNQNIIYLGSVLATALIFFTFYFTRKHYESVSKNVQRTGN
jgi:hypothetical protein